MKKFAIFNLAIILFLFVRCIFYSNNCEAQWVQQTLPYTGTLYSLKFVNQNTGFVSLYSTTENNTTLGYFMKTTNAGFNWTLINNYYVFGFQFLDSLNGYSHGRDYTGNDLLFKTTNCGNSWDSLQISLDNGYADISFLSFDTGWICGFNGNNGTIWKTVNGGLTLIPQYTTGMTSMDKIFFLKEKVNGEYVGWCSQGSFLRKTTNSGINWTQISTLPKPTVTKMYFINQDTGWFNEWGSGGGIFRTTNGGINWIQQNMPSGSQFVIRDMNDFHFINKDTGWGVGGSIWFGGTNAHGIVWATTNGGVNWGYQLPDTNLNNIFFYSKIDFLNMNTGWAYAGLSGIHTTTGGGQIIYTSINTINAQVTKGFLLNQNYPNPFNTRTVISYLLFFNSKVQLKIYDITGREISELVNQNQKAGKYELNWNASNLSSGIYLYTLYITDLKNNKIYRETKKMILNK